MNPQDVIDFVGSAKALLPTIQADTTASKAAIADLSAKFQALQERAHAPQVKAPTGESLQRFLRDDGGVRLARTVKSVNFAGRTVQTDEAGLLDSAPVDAWHQDLLRMVSARKICKQVFGATPATDDRILCHLAIAPREIRSALEATVQKAISDSANSGAEWIPDVMGSQLYEEYYTPAGIATLFDTTDIPARQAGMTVPKISDIIRPYLKGKITSDDPAKYTASTPTSSNTTIEAVGTSVRVLIDDSAVEDSIFSLVDVINMKLGRALTDGYEDCMINGDTTATHEDTIASWNTRSRWGTSGLGGSADHRRGFKGLRRIAVDRTATVDQGSGQTIAKVMEELLGGLGERGNMNAVILVSPEVFFKKMLTDTNVLTVDKLGLMGATLLNGQLAAISGVPVVMTRWLTADLAASGLYTGSGAKSGILAVSREEFRHYMKRQNTVEIAKDITIGGYNLVATRRCNFATLSSSSSSVVRYGYNWL